MKTMLAQVRSACNFFLNSPKREALLIAIITKGVIDTSRRKPLPVNCDFHHKQSNHKTDHSLKTDQFVRLFG